MTRDQLLAQLARQRARKINLTWAQLAGTITAADQTTKDRLLLAANTYDGATLAKTFSQLVSAKKLDLATAEVAAAAVDDNLTIDELLALLG